MRFPITTPRKPMQRWSTGEKKATWQFPDDSVFWNNWGGITVFLEDGDLLLGGFFAIKRYDTGGLR